MSFNLSLAKQEVEQNPQMVQAKPELDIKKNPQTGEEYTATSTDGGVEINKGEAPALVLTGPVGYQCTDLLNRILTKESMGALIAAYEDDQELNSTQNAQHSGNPQGITETDLTTGQSISLTVPNPKSFLYVADGDTLTSRQVSDALNSVNKAKRDDPTAEVAIAVVANGPITPTLESLVTNARRFGVRIAMTKHGVGELVDSIVARHKK